MKYAYHFAITINFITFYTQIDLGHMNYEEVRSMPGIKKKVLGPYSESTKNKLHAEAHGCSDVHARLIFKPHITNKFVLTVK